MIELKAANLRNIYIALLGSCLIYFFGFNPYGYYPSILASISAFFVLYVLLEIGLNKNLKQLYLGIFISLSWVYFQSPFLIKNKTHYYSRVIDEADVPDIAFYSCLSIGLIFVGYNFFNNRVSSLTSKYFKFKESSLKKIVIVFLGLGLFDSLGSRFFPSIMGPLSNVVQVFFYSYTIGFGLFTIFLLRAKEKRVFSLFNVLVILLFILEYTLRVSSTMFVKTSFLFVGVFMAYFYERRKIPISILVISLIVLVPFYQSRKYFRAADVYKSKSNLMQDNRSNFDRGQDFIAKIYSDEGDKQFEKFEKGLKKREKFQSNRFENLSFIAHVVYLHKNGLKFFLYGETFYWLPFTPIPRVIWESKPLNLMSSTFASEYGLRGEGAGTTSINFPMLVEAYVNFGYPGMLFMSLFFGIALKWFAMKFGIGLGDLNLIIMMNSIKQFTHAEGNITLVFGALLQVFIFWFVLLKILRINKSITTL